MGKNTRQYTAGFWGGWLIAFAVNIGINSLGHWADGEPVLLVVDILFVAAFVTMWWLNRRAARR